MNRYRYFIGAVFSLIILLPFSALASEIVGKVTRLTGSAQIYREAVAEPIKVSIGIEIYLHDRISTDEDSKLRIELKDGSILTLGEKANLHLDEFNFDPKKKKRNALFRLLLGKLRVFANDLLGFKDKDFRVKTPTAIIGVRGTLFMVWVKGPTITKVICFEKAIQVANIFKPTEYVVLTENLATDIVSNKAPTKPVLMTEDQLKELRKGLEAATAPVAETTETTEETTTEETTTEETTTEETTTEETTTEETTTEATTTEETTTEATTTAETTTEATTTVPTTTEATTTEATTIQATTTVAATTTAPTTSTTSPTTTTTTTSPTTSTTTTTTPTTTTTTTTTSTTSTTTTTTTTSTTSTSTTTSTSSTTSTTLPKLPGPPGLPGR